MTDEPAQSRRSQKREGSLDHLREKNRRMGAQITALQADLEKTRRQRDEQAIRAGIAERQQRDMRRELDRVRERLRDSKKDHAT